MRKHLVISVLSFIFFSSSILSQSCQDVSVELIADVQTNPPRITLNWRPNTSATGYSVNRKLKSANSWGTVFATLPGTASQFVDSSVVVGISYEYRVVRQAELFTGYGYINSGIEIAAVEQRGLMILIMDSTFHDALSFEINRLMDDLRGDGWNVYYNPVSRTASVVDIKAKIASVYNLLPTGTKAVLLLGHVPVPYSGAINVDGHTDHTGAYPADVYYADMNGAWTDNVINNTTASDPRNHNIPEDGKFDQGIIPSDIDLQIGRVDFYNMPAFEKSELELLRQYLDKNHAYRHKLFTVDHRALIDDNFGYFGGEAFASSAWKSIAPLVGFENVAAGDYFPDLSTGSYLWSYGCGGGWYQGAGGVGTTDNFANSDLQTVFTMLFGSYFGDWDTQNSFLRAPLAQGKTLANVWSGRPHWQFHHMGLGETIGYDVRLSQNNNSLYSSNLGGRWVHIAFMGDPTLRNDIVHPVSNVEIVKNGYHAALTWSPSLDSVLGYHIYKIYGFENEFLRVNDEIITDTFYTDTCLFLQGNYTYMVRAIKLQRTPSGTYYNLSQGISDTILYEDDHSVVAEATFFTEDDIVTFINTSVNATSYLWDFSDGTFSNEADPVHDFTDGSFNVTLIASNECDSDTFTLFVSILTGAKEIDPEEDIIIYPNPTSGKFFIGMNRDIINPLIRIFTMEGICVYKSDQVNARKIEIPALPHGLYIIHISENDSQVARKMIIVK